MGQELTFFLLILGGNKTKDKASSEGTVPKVPLPIDIEKSVDLLLQKARQEADGKQEKNKNINININATPEVIYIYTLIKTFFFHKKIYTEHVIRIS